MMWSSAYYFEVIVHQILAELCPFESFLYCKLFATYCLELIVCKFYFIIGIFFANNLSYGLMGKLLFFFFFLVFFYIFFLLNLQGNVAIIKSLLIHLLNDTELRSLTHIKTYKHNSFWIFFFNTHLSWLL